MIIDIAINEDDWWLMISHHNQNPLNTTSSQEIQSPKPTDLIDQNHGNLYSDRGHTKFLLFSYKYEWGVFLIRFLFYIYFIFSHLHFSAFETESRHESFEMPFLKKWVRTKHAILFRLSNRTVQVLFMDRRWEIFSREKNFI